MIVYNGYPISIIVALGIHSLLFAALIYFQGVDRVEALDLIQPTVIKALTIAENPQLRNEQVQERQRLERLDQQRVARAQEEQREREAAEQAAQEAAAREREAEALRQRQQEEDQRQADLAQQERERQAREAEQQRQRELAEAQQRERQQQEQQRLQEAENQRQADAAAAAAEVARTEREMVQSATGIIQQYVQENWSRPPSARNGMVAEIRIRMLPTGEVIDVSITRSSGDAAFDRAAEQAVYRAAPFRELQNLPAQVFNQNFRTLTITFQPEDLLN